MDSYHARMKAAAQVWREYPFTMTAEAGSLTQLMFYKQALQRLLGLPVKQMLLYSFALGQEIEVK